MDRFAKENIQHIGGLSPMQEAMFLHSRHNPSSVTYFEQKSYLQKGIIDYDTFRRSLQLLSERHEILRTVFVQKKTPKPLQVVLRKSDPEFRVVDLSNEPDATTHINQEKQADRARFFDLGRDVLIRVTVFVLKADEHYLLWSWHHILMDAWAVNQLATEFYVIYSCISSGVPVTLPAVRPYRDYVSWLNDYDDKAAARFWKNYLTDVHAPAMLPYSKARSSSATSYKLEEHSVLLDVADTRRLLEFSANNKITLNTIAKGLWGLLLNKYNNTTDAVFGTIVSCRPADLPGSELIAGLFINTIPVRVKSDTNQSVVEFFRELQKTYLDCTQWHHHSLMEIIAEHPMGRDLVNHVFLFQNTPSGTATHTPSDNNGVEIIAEKTVEEFYYNFNLFVIPAERLQITIKYDGNCFEPDVVRVVRHLSSLFRQLVEGPTKSLGDLSIMDNSEKIALSRLGRGVDFSWGGTSVPREITETARKFPKHPAIEFNGARMSYATLDEQSDRVAYHLIHDMAMRDNEPVAVVLSRSPEMIVALLGIMKAGGCFVPVDPEYPASRSAYILEDAGVTKIITTTEYVADLVSNFEGRLFAIDVQLDLIVMSEAFSMKSPRPSDPAYILYTSGSTGKPKGVDISHEAFANYILWANQYYFADRKDVTFAFFTSICFDLTLTSIFTTLIRGDLIIIHPHKPVDKLLSEIFCERTDIKAVKMTPSHVVLLDALNIKSTAVDQVIIGGERVDWSHVERLKKLNPHMRIYNEYGPTETTVGCTVEDVTDGDVSAGSAIYNTLVAIHDLEGLPVPQGIIGEIVVGGGGVANGYRNNPELTNCKFVQTNYFGQRVVMYKTGDIGRWNSKGKLEVLGRVDDQIKVLGHRIDPVEIEDVLKKITDADFTYVTSWRTPAGYNELVAYIKGQPDHSTPDVILANCRKLLPAYLIPHHIVFLDNIPLTANGKVDKTKLPQPVGDSSLEVSKGEDSFQLKVIEIWEEVLMRDNIGPDSNFFLSGGHSLKAAQILSRINAEFQCTLELSTIFDNPTVRAVAAAIKGRTHQELLNIPRVEAKSFYDLSSSQKRIWLTDQLINDNLPGQDPVVFTVHEQLNKTIFLNTVDVIIDRHESLRTRFPIIDGEPKQQIQEKLSATDVVKFIDCTGSGSIIDEEFENLRQLHMDLGQGPLIRFIVLVISNEKYVVLFKIHHIVSDGWSLELLIREFSKVSDALSAGRPHDLPTLNFHYRDFAAWQNAFVSGDNSQSVKEYWRKRLDGATKHAGLPSDFPRPKATSGTQGVHVFQMSERAVAIAELIATAENVTMFMVLLTLVKFFVYRVTGTTDIRIGSAVAGRLTSDMELQVGNYFNLVVMRTFISPGDTFRQALRKVRSTVLGAFDNQTYPFDCVLQDLNIRNGMHRNPLFDIGLTFQNQIETLPATFNLQSAQKQLEGRRRSMGMTDFWFEVRRVNSGLVIYNAFNADLFTEETVTKYCADLVAMSDRLLANPDIAAANIRCEQPVIEETFTRVNVNLNI